MKKLWTVVGMAALLFVAPFTAGVLIEFFAIMMGYETNIFYLSTFPTVIYPLLIYTAAVQMRKIAKNNKYYKAAYILFGIGIGLGAFQWVLGLTMRAESYILASHFMKAMIYYYAWRKLRKYEKRERARSETAPAFTVVSPDGEVIEWPKQ